MVSSKNAGILEFAAIFGRVLLYLKVLDRVLIESMKMKRHSHMGLMIFVNVVTWWLCIRRTNLENYGGPGGTYYV